MKSRTPSRGVNRREFLKYAGGALGAAAGAGIAPGALRNVLRPQAALAQTPGIVPDLEFVGTDGWISLPDTGLAPFHPDDLAPGAGDAGFAAQMNTYMFGFRNVTGLNETQRLNQKMHVTHPAPMFWLNEGDAFHIRLGNLGLQMRPDLFDDHTIHFHGMRNVIPFFDGEPTSSVAVPPGETFTYYYKTSFPGTYMYHCHVEEAEHVQQGMTGIVFVRPGQDGNTALYSSGRYLYNDGDGSTGFDREFVMFMSELWAEAHWADSHVQLPDWTTYRVDYPMLNGRVYPDTLAPNGSIDPFAPAVDGGGYLVPTAGYEHLQYQPLSALVTCNEGERVALRFANLGFQQAAMTLAGIPMRVVGRDAHILRNPAGDDLGYDTQQLLLNAGQSADVLFTAPPFDVARATAEGLSYNRYLLYDRRTSLAPTSGHGRITEVRVYPATTVGPQATSVDGQPIPNDHGGVL